MLFKLDIAQILIVLPVLIFSLVLHELAHGWTSKLLGDPTPENEGRLTLNPLRHLDPMGTLFLLLAGFGWAKPVRVNPWHYKNRNWGVVLVSLAGPLTNLLIASLTMLLFKGITLTGISSSLLNYLWIILRQLIVTNIVFFVFNMIPIPPLDGSRLVSAALSRRHDLVQKYNQYGFYILIAFMLINSFLNIEILPISRMTAWVFGQLANLFF